MAQAMAVSYGKTALPAATALENTLKRVVPQIRVIIELCGRKSTGMMQPSVDKIVKMCLDEGLAEKRNVMPRHTGIHPENRGKTGVDPFNAQKLTLKITIQGYSETKLESPMGFQKAAPGPLHDEQQAFNETNFAEGNGYIKAIEFRDIEYLPVTCSHTFATVNIVEGGGPGFHDELCNDAGYIDRSKVLELCPSWEKPMTEGIPCTVFKRELDVACPELASFFSKAGNQSHGVHTQETRVQHMLTLNQHFVASKLRAASSVPAEQAPTWERVVRETVAIKGPDLADCLKECAEFAAAWAGDDKSTALKEVESYSKQMTRRNEPEQDQLHYLAAAQLARYPNYPIMCLKTLISAPDKWAIKGEAKMFNSTNVKEMGTSKAAKVAAACVCDDKAREWFGTDLTNNPAFSAKVLGNMETRLVMFVHNFNVKSRPKFATMDEICIDFAKEVRDLGGDMTNCPWKFIDASAPVAAAQDTPKVSTIIEYGKDGSIGQLQLKTVFGMELGTTVTLKVPGTGAQAGVKSPVYHIVKMDGPGSQVVSIDICGMDVDSIPQTKPVGELVDLYKTITFVQDIIVRADAIPRIETYEEVFVESIKSSLKALLLASFRLHEPMARVDLTIKGDDTKLVFASVDTKVGQMKLVPFSKHITVAVEGKAKINPTSVEVKLAGPKGAKYVAAVMQMLIGKFDRVHTKPLKDNIVVPYWLVRRVLDKSMANMQKTTMPCTLTTEAGGEKVVQKVSLPIIHNIKDLKEGDELVLYAEPSIPTTIMPAQSLELVSRKRPAEAVRPKAPVSRMQKKQKKN